MNFNAMIDVALGLSALFWLVATAASFAVEAIHSAMNQRATALLGFMRQMVVGGPRPDDVKTDRPERERADPADPAASGSVQAVALDVTDHPLLRRL